LPNKISLMLITVLLSSCTSKDLYKSFQPNKSTCSKQPTAQYGSCLKQIEEQMTYDEYSKERKKL
jgi:hypothetical protein